MDGFRNPSSTFTGSETAANLNSANAKTVTVKAKWVPISYTISYTLNDGTISGANPTSFTIETNTFTLINPTKNGYTFKGWTGSNGSTPQTSVSIVKGSVGNKSYTANWESCSGVESFGGYCWKLNRDSKSTLTSATTYCNSIGYKVPSYNLASRNASSIARLEGNSNWWSYVVSDGSNYITIQSNGSVGGEYCSGCNLTICYR